VSKNISELCEYLRDKAEQAVIDVLGSLTVKESIAELRRIESEKHTTQASIAAQ
jgi:Rrf2 family transcriptional repressor of oqxAB